MQQAQPRRPKQRVEIPRREPRRFLARSFTPESDEHVETANEGPADALLVISKGAQLETERRQLKELAVAGLAAARAKEAELRTTLAESSEEDQARVNVEIGKQRAVQERLARDVRSRIPTVNLTLMFRLRAGELSGAARLEGAMLVPAEGDPVPLRFEGGRSGRAVTMTATVKMNTAFYVALHLVGLAGVQVEVLLLGGGTVVPVHA